MPELTDLVDRFGIIVAWLLVVIFFAVIEPDTFFTVANFQTVFGSQAVLLILALALLIPLTVGEFDLSVTGALSISVVLPVLVSESGTRTASPLDRVGGMARGMDLDEQRCDCSDA